MEPWTLVTKDDNYALAHWRNIFAVVWRQETTVEGADHLRSACTEFAATRPEGIGLLTIVESGAPLPPAPARKAIAEFLNGGSDFIRCSAVVFEGSGFRAAAVRSVVTGLTLMAGQRYPHRVCSFDDAVLMYTKILPEATGQPLDAQALRESFAAFREQLDR